MLWFDLYYDTLQVYHTLETTWMAMTGKRRDLCWIVDEWLQGLFFVEEKRDGELRRISDDAFGTEHWRWSIRLQPITNQIVPSFFYRNSSLVDNQIIPVVYSVRRLQAGRDYFHRRATRRRRHLNRRRCVIQANDDDHHSEARVNTTCVYETSAAHRRGPNRGGNSSGKSSRTPARPRLPCAHKLYT